MHVRDVMCCCWQKEHSNLISSIRATNEPPASAVSAGGERVPVITETRDHELGANTQLGAVVGGSIRQRRKIERNTSAPLPGMLQV